MKIGAELCGFYNLIHNIIVSVASAKRDNSNCHPGPYIIEISGLTVSENVDNPD